MWCWGNCRCASSFKYPSGKRCFFLFTIISNICSNRCLCRHFSQKGVVRMRFARLCKLNCQASFFTIWNLSSGNYDHNFRVETISFWSDLYNLSVQVNTCGPIWIECCNDLSCLHRQLCDSHGCTKQLLSCLLSLPRYLLSAVSIWVCNKVKLPNYKTTCVWCATVTNLPLSKVFKKILNWWIVWNGGYQYNTKIKDAVDLAWQAGFKVLLVLQI